VLQALGSDMPELVKRYANTQTYYWHPNVCLCSAKIGRNTQSCADKSAQLGPRGGSANVAELPLLEDIRPIFVICQRCVHINEMDMASVACRESKSAGQVLPLTGSAATR